MSLEEKNNIESIQVTSDGFLIVKEVIIILKDSVEISRNEKRYHLHPGADLTNQDPKVVSLANVVWTKEIMDAFNLKNINREDKTQP